MSSHNNNPTKDPESPTETLMDPETAFFATTTTNSTLVVKDNDSTSQAPTKSSKDVPSNSKASTSESKKHSWLAKLKSSKPSEPGQEKWRDASLSDKERWKEWQKAKDQEMKKGSTAGYFTEYYKGKKGWAYWLDVGL